MRKIPVELITCACGCGSLINSRYRGNPRRYALHHRHRKPGGDKSIAEKVPVTVISCACGCGETLTSHDDRGRLRKFIPSHSSRLQPNDRIPIPCMECGTVVLKARWQRKRVKRHFCSMQCEGKWSSRAGTRKGEQNGHYNSITVQCAGCDGPVTKAVSLIMRRNNRVYCPDCIPLVRTGKPGFYVGYPKEFNNRLRKSIRDRDGNQCQVCGKTKEDAGTLQVHHIDYNKHNNSPVNLIALCCFCHGQTNWATEAWKARLQDHQSRRFPERSSEPA